MESKQKVLLRQQLMIDQNVQGSLLRRAGLYSLCCAIYFIVILVFTETMSDPTEPFLSALMRCLDESIYWAPGLMLLSPVLAYDLLRVTNRFAGPMFRLRREMQRLIDGESEHPLSFRDGDYWIEVADIFNELRDELQELRRAKESFVARQEAERPEAVRHQQLFTDDEEEAAEDFLNSGKTG